MTTFILLLMYIPFGYIAYRVGWRIGEESGFEAGVESMKSGT